MFRSQRSIFPSSSRSERGEPSTANDTEATPAPAASPSPAAPSTPGVPPRQRLSPQQLSTLQRTPGVSTTSRERLLQASRNDNRPSPQTVGGLYTWSGQPRPSTEQRIAGGAAAADNDIFADNTTAATANAASRARGRNLAPLETTPRGARRPSIFQRAAARGAQAVAPPQSLAVNRGHYIDPAILAQLPAELTPNVPGQDSSRPVATTSGERGSRHFGHRQLVPVSREQSSGTWRSLTSGTLASFSSELAANSPSIADDNTVLASSARQPGLGLTAPNQWIADPFSDELPSERTGYPARMPFNSSSSADATRSGDSEGWATSPNLSRQGAEVVARPAINTAGRSLAANFGGSALTGRAVGSGESGEHGWPSYGESSCPLPASSQWPREPFPVLQYSPPGSADSDVDEESADTQHPGWMDRGREQDPDAGILAHLSTWPRNNPFRARVPYDDAASSPYARLPYEHPSPMPTGHRNPFALTPPTLSQHPARPQAQHPRAGAIRSPGLNDLESAPTAGQPERPWTRPSNVAVERSPELDDGSTFPSTPARPRARHFGVAAEGSWPGFASSMTPSGATVSPASTAGAWVSNYNLRHPVRSPARLDAVSEASSPTPRGGRYGEGRSELASSTEHLVVPGNGRSQRRKRERDSWWRFSASSEDRLPTSRQGTEAPLQGSGSMSVGASSPSPAQRRVGRFLIQSRADLSRQQGHSPEQQTPQTVRDRPARRGDMRGLQRYLDSRRVSSYGKQTNDSATAIVSSSPLSPPSLRPGRDMAVEWTDIPLGDPPTLQQPAPPHNQALAPQAIARQRRLSLFCLVVFTVFPPLAFLYTFGYLDWFPNWWTQGHVPSLRPMVRKAAIPSTVVLWILVITIAVVLSRNKS